MLTHHLRHESRKYREAFKLMSNSLSGPDTLLLLTLLLGEMDASVFIVIS